MSTKTRNQFMGEVDEEDSNDEMKLIQLLSKMNEKLKNEKSVLMKQNTSLKLKVHQLCDKLEEAEASKTNGDGSSEQLLEKIGELEEELLEKNEIILKMKDEKKTLVSTVADLKEKQKKEKTREKELLQRLSELEHLQSDSNTAMDNWEFDENIKLNSVLLDNPFEDSEDTDAKDQKNILVQVKEHLNNRTKDIQPKETSANNLNKTTRATKLPQRMDSESEFLNTTIETTLKDDNEPELNLEENIEYSIDYEEENEVAEKMLIGQKKAFRKSRIFGKMADFNLGEENRAIPNQVKSPFSSDDTKPPLRDIKARALRPREKPLPPTNSSAINDRSDFSGEQLNPSSQEATISQVPSSPYQKRNEVSVNSPQISPSRSLEVSSPHSFTASPNFSANGLKTLTNITLHITASSLSFPQAGQTFLFYITMESLTGEVLYEISRTYTDFVALDKNLHKRLPREIISFIPALPEKSLFSGYSPVKSDKRKSSLEKYLNELKSVIPENEVLIHFLMSSSHSEIHPHKVTYRPGVMKGYLTKRGKSFGNWISRFYTLEQDGLYYYDCEGGPFCGKVALMHSSVQILVDDKESEFLHGFVISDVKRGSHIFCADSGFIRDMWVQAIRFYTGDVVGVAAIQAGMGIPPKYDEISSPAQASFTPFSLETSPPVENAGSTFNEYGLPYDGANNSRDMFSRKEEESNRKKLMGAFNGYQKESGFAKSNYSRY